MSDDVLLAIFGRGAPAFGKRKSRKELFYVPLSHPASGMARGVARGMTRGVTRGVTRRPARSDARFYLQSSPL